MSGAICVDNPLRLRVPCFTNLARWFRGGQVVSNIA